MTTQTITRPTAPAAAPITTGRATRKGWHEDPRGEHKLRFHDGDAWTDHTTHFGPVPCQGCAR